MLLGGANCHHIQKDQNSAKVFHYHIGHLCNSRGGKEMLMENMLQANLIWEQGVKT